jgi:malate synthase
VFEDGLDGAPNQLSRSRDDVDVAAADLLDLPATPGKITEAGLRTNVNVCFQYISFWLTGRGAAAINSLMEDAATAEISRSQIWQWVRHGKGLEDGTVITRDLVRQVLDEEMAEIRERVGDEIWRAGRPEETREIFERVALADELIEFLTIPAYDYLD